jgi:hypothetical protein
MRGITITQSVRFVLPLRDNVATIVGDLHVNARNAAIKFIRHTNVT